MAAGGGPFLFNFGGIIRCWVRERRREVRSLTWFFTQ